MLRNRFFKLLILVTMAFTAFRAPDDLFEKLKKQFKDYAAQHPSTCLFLHTDKTRYAPNEDIWFKAYVLSGNVIDNKVLYVRLTDRNRKVILTDQFPVYDIRSHGDILLPDTLKDGEYYLYAYTDRMINFSDDDVFMQPISVFRNQAKRLDAEASVTDTTKIRRGEKIDILVKVKENGTLLDNVKGEYRLLDGEKVIKNGRLTTNNFGEATVSFVYPQLADDRSLKVKLNFTRNTDFASLDLNLRHEANPVVIQAFPEGGQLVAGIRNHLVIAAMDINRLPVNTLVKLVNNGQEVSSVQTGIYGLAAFDILPRENDSYTFHVDKQSKPIDLQLRIEPNGYGLALTQNEDATDVTLTNQGEQGNGLLVVRSYETVLWSEPVTIPPGKSIKVNLPLEDLPQEMLSVAFFDGSGVPRAERLLVNKPAPHFKVALKTDQKSYGLRKKVTVSLQITDQKDAPAATNVSIAAIERSGLDLPSYVNILDYYDSRFLDKKVPVRVLSGMNAKEKEDLLIAKSWQHSAWKDIVAFTPGEPLTLLKNTGGITGYLERLTKKKKPVDLVLYSKAGVQVVPVNDDDTFSIRPEDLTAKRGNEFYVIQSDDFRSKYQIHYDDHDLAFDKKIGSGQVLRIPQSFNVITQNKLPAGVVSSLSRGIQLAEIKIGATNNSGFREFRSKDCKDYVCPNNILNCSNHANAPGNYSPTEGAIYQYRSFPGSKEPNTTVVYRGCGRIGNTSIIKNISIPKKFYLPDYDKTPSYEPELRTTIYWNPNSGTTDEGTNTFSFFTSDIKGEFLVIVQGIDVHTLLPVFGTTTFSVK